MSQRALSQIAVSLAGVPPGVGSGRYATPQILGALQACCKLGCSSPGVTNLQGMMHAGKFSELYCQRCPKLKSASDYALLLVAVSDGRRHRSSVLQLLPVSTRDVTPPTFLTAPSISNVRESSFTLSLALSEPGKSMPRSLHHVELCSHSHLF